MAGTWDWKKEAERLKEMALEHQRKLETDPEYRKRDAELDKFVNSLYMGAPPEDED